MVVGTAVGMMDECACLFVSVRGVADRRVVDLTGFGSVWPCPILLVSPVGTLRVSESVMYADPWICGDTLLVELLVPPTSFEYTELSTSTWIKFGTFEDLLVLRVSTGVMASSGRLDLRTNGSPEDSVDEVARMSIDGDTKVGGIGRLFGCIRYGHKSGGCGQRGLCTMARQERNG